MVVRMIKMFYSGTYKVRHELINKDNVLELLKDDIRSKIVGNVKDTVYSSDGVIIRRWFFQPATNFT